MNAFRVGRCCRAVAGVLRAARAQTGNRITEPSSPPPSRWQQDKEQLDAALRARALTVTDPRGLWVAGQLDTGDPARTGQRVRAGAHSGARRNGLSHIARARAASSRCGRRCPECDATDRLADWATRDVDNGVPMLLLADRARQRNNNLDGRASRGSRDAPALRRLLEPRERSCSGRRCGRCPCPAERAAKAELATAYGAAQLAVCHGRRDPDRCAAMREGDADERCDRRAMRRARRRRAARGDVVVARGRRPPGRNAAPVPAAAGGRAATASPTSSAARSNARKPAIRSRLRSNRADPRRACARRRRVGKAARAGRATGRGRGVRARGRDREGLVRITSPARSTAPARSRRCASWPSGCRCIWYNAISTVSSASTRRNGWIAAPSMSAPSEELRVAGFEQRRVAFAHHAQKIVGRAELRANAGRGKAHRRRAVAGLQRSQLIVDDRPDRLPFALAGQARSGRRGGGEGRQCDPRCEQTQRRASAVMHTVRAHGTRRIARDGQARAIASPARRRGAGGRRATDRRRQAA